MPPTRALQRLRVIGPVFRSRDAVAAGVSWRDLDAPRDDGELLQLSSGVFQSLRRRIHRLRRRLRSGPARDDRSGLGPGLLEPHRRHPPDGPPGRPRGLAPSVDRSPADSPPRLSRGDLRPRTGRDPRALRRTIPDQRPRADRRRRLSLAAPGRRGSSARVAAAVPRTTQAKVRSLADVARPASSLDTDQGCVAGPVGMSRPDRQNAGGRARQRWPRRRGGALEGVGEYVAGVVRELVAAPTCRSTASGPAPDGSTWRAPIVCWRARGLAAPDSSGWVAFTRSRVWPQPSRRRRRRCGGSRRWRTATRGRHHRPWR